MENVEEESSAALTELFHGFLAMCTLGEEPINTDPSTPPFSISADQVAEKETKATENELKLINGELEKVLGAEGRDESCNNISLGRNSHASARSSSQSSIKQLENAAIDENEIIICPLQDYIFGSPPAKKEHRTSLGDLLHKTKLEEENPGDNSGMTEKQTVKSILHIMKRMLHASITSSTEASCGHLDSASAEKKLLKILHKFHKKIRPGTPTKNDMKGNITAMRRGSHIGGLMPAVDNIKICPQPNISKESIGTFKSQSYLPQFTLDSGNREHWVKTDADYLVLEL